ncbi:UDP-Glycosyltransferase/glycogen phosphorylase, partial [Lichtheimia hyalospora FSU 10163]
MIIALRQVLKDEQGVIRKDIRRLQAIMQIHAQHSLAHAIDLVVEMTPAADNEGKLRHRQDIVRNLSFLKRNKTSPKNILFSSVMGGASHNAWVIRVLDQLHNRGHNVFFATTDPEMRFGDGHPHVKTSSIGPSHFRQIPRIAHGLRVTPILFDLPKVYKANTLREYKTNYNALHEIIKTESIDVVMCDHISYACQEVAKDEKLPLIITMVINDADDASPAYMNKHPMVRMSHSNTERMTYARRFYDAFIWRAQALWHLNFSPWPISLAVNDKRWEDALKLVNNVYGIEDPRPMGPLVELVGPIYNDDITSAGKLDPDLQQFLDARQRVVYVAF